MTPILQWSRRWAVSPEALRELVVLLEGPPVAHGDGVGPESVAQQQCRLASQTTGARLWRNNVGAGKLDNGSFLRWGLCNDSARLNDHIKSADLVGLQPVVITAEMVGATFGRFVAREIKAPGWRYTGTDREEAQNRFLQLVNAMGGDGKFSTGGY